MGFGGVGGGGGERSSGEWKSLSGILVGLISFSEQILFSEQMDDQEHKSYVSPTAKTTMLDGPEM